MGEYEVLSSGTFVELLSFRLPPHQSLHLCETFNSLNVSISIYIYIYKQRPHVREHEILPTDTFVELLSFRLPHHQSLHLCKTFNLLNVSMK